MIMKLVPEFFYCRISNSSDQFVQRNLRKVTDLHL